MAASAWTPVEDTSIWKPVEDAKLAPPEKPGYGTRLAQSIGVPSSKEELAQRASMFTNPADSTLTGVASKVIKGYGSQVKANYDDYHESLRGLAADLNAGRMTKEQGMRQLFNLSAEQAIKAVPGLGQSLWNYGSDVQQGNYAGAAGGATGIAAQVLAPKIAESIPGAKIGQTAKILAKPGVEAATEAVKDIPVVRGVVKGLSKFKDVPGQLKDVWNPAEAGSAVANETGVAEAPKGAEPPIKPTTKPEAPQFAYRSRDAGETGIMPLSGKAQASLDPARVTEYQEGRAAAQNHPQEVVKVDLSKMHPSEYSIADNGYVKFKVPVPESFIEKMPSEAAKGAEPPVPMSQASTKTQSGNSQASNLLRNIRQMKTGSTRPPVNMRSAATADAPDLSDVLQASLDQQLPKEIKSILNTPGDVSDADMATLQKYDFRNRKWK